MKIPDDVWASGARYEPYVGRWSRLVARDFLTWLGLPPALNWLDVGCGTGALSSSILEHSAPRAVTGIDPSVGFTLHAKRHLSVPNARFVVADARALPFRASVFGGVVSGLVLNFVPDPRAALDEMLRVVGSGGSVAAYVWDYAGRMDFMRYFWDSAVAVDPRSMDLDEGRRFQLCSPGPLSDLFRGAGLRGVEVRAIDIPTIFKDFDDFWLPFLGGQGSAPTYVATLDEVRLTRLREHVRAHLPFDSDGSIHLIARAWAVRGTRR